jgi:molecular chaperone GrpE
MTEPNFGHDRPENPELSPGDAPRSNGAGAVDGDSDPGRSLPIDEQIAQLRKERDDYREQALRSRAEFANYQKRSKQQADADRVYAVGSLAKDLLDPLDNLSRAVDALRGSGAEGITAGLDMVQRQLLEVLAKHGVEPISALGEPFDPNLHEALVQQPTNAHPEGTVVGELSKGYKIRDRVLRPTKVAVSSHPAAG